MICADKNEMFQEVDFHGYCCTPRTTGKKGEEKDELPSRQVSKQPCIPTASQNSLAEIPQYRDSRAGQAGRPVVGKL